MLKEYEEIWCKIENLIRFRSNNMDHYDDKYIKIGFDANGYLPLRKT